MQAAPISCGNRRINAAPCRKFVTNHVKKRRCGHSRPPSRTSPAAGPAVSRRSCGRSGYLLRDRRCPPPSDNRFSANFQKSAAAIRGTNGSLRDADCAFRLFSHIIILHRSPKCNGFPTSPSSGRQIRAHGLSKIFRSGKPANGGQLRPSSLWISRSLDTPEAIPRTRAPHCRD